MKMFCLLILCFGLIPLESPRADYVLSLKHEGSATVSTTPGGRFSVAAVLSTNAADQHDSVIFRIVFSAPGLVLESYQWSAPYLNNVSDDFSTPRFDTLPQTINADTYHDGSTAVDMYLSNVTFTPFGVGTLVTLHFLVPANYSGPETVTMQVVPDTLALGFPPPIPTVPGVVFTANISGFRITSLVRGPTPDQAILSWSSSTGQLYDIMMADIPGGTETAIRSNITGIAGEMNEPVPLNSDKGVFRIRQRPTP